MRNDRRKGRHSAESDEVGTEPRNEGVAGSSPAVGSEVPANRRFLRRLRLLHSGEVSLVGKYLVAAIFRIGKHAHRAWVRNECGMPRVTFSASVRAAAARFAGRAPEPGRG